MKFGLLLIALLLASTVDARRVKTSRQAISPSTRPTAAAVDTIIAPTDTMIAFSGYDKPLRASRESFFVTNNTDSFIHSIAVTIEYLDMTGRQLHKAFHHIVVDIPRGETRSTTIPSWDRQQSFYYHRSNQPRRAKAYPYKVVLTADTVFIAK